MSALLAQLGLPTDHVAAWSAEQAAERSGLPHARPAWFYPGGGWLDPRSLVAHWLTRPGITLRTGAAVQRIVYDAGRWQLLDAQNRTIAAAPVLVMANGHDASRLLDHPGWPLERRRGQLTQVPAATPGLRAPRLPVAGLGYALTLPGGDVLCGATTHEDDEDPTLREDDHRFNLERLQQLTGSLPRPDSGLARLGGRVGWRLQTDDRLPIIGAMPATSPHVAPPGTRVTPVTQPRHVERVPGLFVCTAFASRGIGWAPLAGQLLASWVTGAPAPVGAALIDAVDPARFAVRRLRNSAS
jgi:tRNA 5-methylaminomethyl-2-thiouridine biosynthesis bifunctional protein